MLLMIILLLYDIALKLINIVINGHVKFQLTIQYVIVDIVINNIDVQYFTL